MLIEQISKDTLEVDYFHSVALCQFSWGNNKRTQVVLLGADAVAKAIGKRKSHPVDAVAKIASKGLGALSDNGLDVVRRLGPTHLSSYGRIFDTGYPVDEPLGWSDDPVALKELLAGKDAQDVASRVFIQAGDGALFAPGASVEDGPINFPVYFEISNRYVDIDAAEEHLKGHPMVLAVTREKGRPGSYDHVPSSLRLVVQLPDKLRSKIEAQSRSHYARYIRSGEYYGASASEFERVFTWGLATRPRENGDVLGLAKFARKRDSYDEPRDDYDSDYYED